MKLVSKSGKHVKPAGGSYNSKPKSPEFDETYLDDMLADVLGTKQKVYKAEIKKTSAPKKTEAPVNRVSKPTVTAKAAAPAKKTVTAKPAAPAKKEAPGKAPAVSVKREVLEKDPADELALIFDDEWDAIFSKNRKTSSAPTEKEAKKSSKSKANKKSDSFDWGMGEVSEIDESDNEEVPEKSKKSKKTKKEKKKKRSLGKRLLNLFLAIAILVGAYFFFVYTKIPFIASLRDTYIETAMSTMSHQWMAEWFFPQDVIDDVVNRVENAQKAQQGLESAWKKKPKKEKKDKISDEEKFYELFWEIDKSTFEDYLKDHPEVLDKGWDEIYINEAGLEDNGTSIWTKMDEQVLAIDVPNQILLIRVKGSGYQGVLAVAKDASRMSCVPAQNVGSYGERLEDIMKRTDAVIGMTGSGFIDEGGNGNGGSIVGFARCNGNDYGYKVGGSYKRIELREDNLLYIVDSANEVDSKTTDAVEFAPALVINGEPLIDQLSGFTSINPRACIGQSDKGEILMLCIEGRLPSRSFGCGLPECTEIFMQHNAYQAMNLDGGTSAIMWYRGEYVIKCSNTAITCRTLPNAWIYAKEPLD